MGNSYIDISVHIIFHTKKTGVLIREEDLPHVFRYIGGIIKNNAGIALQIGGRPDHIHILAMLPGTISICDFVRIIKTNTSKWIKGLNSSYRFFAWQEGFGAFSVSEPNRKAVVDYIINQKDHHKKRTGQEELLFLLQKWHVGIHNNDEKSPPIFQPRKGRNNIGRGQACTLCARDPC